MEERDLVRPYVADGIEEFDNPMPRWWVGLFYATIVFGVAYLLRYHLMGGPSRLSASKYERAQARQETQNLGPRGGTEIALF